ncbi:MAG: hypothetical protein ABJA82_04655 [Myxococcales bacterium]
MIEGSRSGALAAAVFLLLSSGLAVTFGTRSANAAKDAKAQNSRLLRHRAEFVVVGIVALQGDRFLLWDDDGRMQTGTGAGEWSKTFQVAIHPVWDVKADGTGFLASGRLNGKGSVIVRATAEGQELTRWTVSSPVYSVVVDAIGRAASTAEGLVPLLEGGNLGKPIPWAPPPRDRPARPRPRVPAVVAREDSSMITCVMRDLSMLYGAPGRCQRVGGAEWHFEGDFGAPFVPCGDSLIVVEGSRPWKITVHSMRSGKRESQIRTSLQPVVACVNPGELLVANRRLSIVRLPNSKPIWTAGASGAAINDVALTETALAYSADDSPDVVIIPRPR